MLPAVNAAYEFGPGQIQMLSTRCKARYGWNLLRWLFNRPLYYEVVYTFSLENPQ